MHDYSDINLNEHLQTGDSLLSRTYVDPLRDFYTPLPSAIQVSGENLVSERMLQDAIIGDAHITGVITVAHTEAKCTDALADQTSANPQSHTWLSDSIELAKLGTTIIEGGYIKTGLVSADNINVGTLVVARSEAKCTDALADQTSAGTAAAIASQGALATLNTVGTATVDTTIITGGKIVTGLLTATNIQTGTLTLASGGVNLVASTGELTLNPGADLVLQTTDVNWAALNLVDSVTPTDFVSFFTTPSGATQIVPQGTWINTKGFTIANFSEIRLHPTVTGVIFPGVTTESAQNEDNVRIGVLAGSPRVIFENSGYTQYEIDVTTTSLRFLSPGLALYHMHSGAFFPEADETKNLGGASNAWNVIYYKTLSDVGCLFSCDKGVELQSGEIVSDMEALRSIKTHPTKKSVQGLPMLDYRTMPKPVYMPSDFDTYGNPIPRDKDDNAYIMEEVKGKKVRREVSDGADFGALVSIMLGGMKELDNRLAKVEARA